jgi:glycosyltransferase involved in cell wall biosynthesis/peptidoglycan/xylan/chitin deacetylase (PgdA/CDA1 family)/SAM-dependent methyltransferase
MSNNPLTSAIIVFLNERKFIQESIESVLAQTYDNWELLLVDDGSTDGSTEIALRYAKQYPGKVRYLEHEGHQNHGAGASRNLGIHHSKGEYIAVLDADDVWLPQKLKDQVPILNSQPDAGMLYAATKYWYSWTGNPEDLDRDYVWDNFFVAPDALIDPPDLLVTFLTQGDVVPCTGSLLLRRRAIEQVGGYEESFRCVFTDQSFYAKLCLKTPIYVSSGCWDMYRQHPDSSCNIAEQIGLIDAARLYYLTWLEKKLFEEGINSTKVWQALQRALSPYRQPVYFGDPSSSFKDADGKENRWWLRVAGGSVANLMSSINGSDLVRIAIQKAKTRKSYDIQLNQPRLKVRAGQRYRVQFQARADRPRSLFVGVAEAHEPWTGLGMYQKFKLTSEWQKFAHEFLAFADDNNARIHFDVGDSDIPVELALVGLRHLPDGESIEPGPQSVQIGNPKRGEDSFKDISEGRERLAGNRRLAFGEVQFGTLRRVTPVSKDWGFDRGRPVDRYYIEKFLARYAKDIRGEVLEIGDNSYTREFGANQVTKSDVLHVVEGNPQATLVADLTCAPQIFSRSFDCIILTQTLQLIYDVRAAIQTLYRILKPGGVLLATFPGISQTNDREWGNNWYWNFTTLSARRLFEEVFSAADVRVEAFGNVLAATSFLHGLAVEELTPEELDYHEPGYDVTITVRAEKPGAADQPQAINKSWRATPGFGDSFDRKALVLMYHRVADGCADPWSLCVSPQRFAQQLEVLRRYTHPMQLQELVKAASSGNIPSAGVVVTFDDGYADNLHNAKPLLERYDIPATVFVTTGYFQDRGEFWWDELERILLQPGTLPGVLRLIINGTVHQWELGEASYYGEERWWRDRSWKAPKDPPTSRHSIYVSLWRLLKLLPHSERRNLLNKLLAWARAESQVRPTHRALSLQEIVDLAQGKLIEVGSHTVTHPVLAMLPLDLQRDEIQQSKASLENILERSVTSFAYPYGARCNYTDETVATVRGAGFTCACSTLTGFVNRGVDRFQLPRVQVEDWEGQEFSRRLFLWFGGSKEQ